MKRDIGAEARVLFAGGARREGDSRHSARSAARRAMPRAESVDTRMISIVRVVLAISAFAIVAINPPGAERLILLTYGALVAYSAYGIILYFAASKDPTLPAARVNHWIDVGFGGCFVALTGVTSGIFFFLLAILAASFSRGYREGLLVTAASAALFTGADALIVRSAGEFELSRTLIHSVPLLALGCAIAHWGGCGIMLKRGLTLLKEANELCNPRFGVDHTIGSNLDRLLEYYGARSCVLVLQRPTQPPGFLLYRASAGKPTRSTVPNNIAEPLARKLLRLPETVAAAYHDGSSSRWSRTGDACFAFDLVTRSRNDVLVEGCGELANLLDAPSFITVPYWQRDGTVGRIFVASDDRVFTRSDVDFLSQVAGTISPVVDNLRLMDELVSKAAEHQRHQISRDIHDTTIQPYIGLKLGLDALYRDAKARGQESERIGELIEMANMTIRDLRAYAAKLRDTASMPGDALVAAVNEQVERYRRFYGIEVDLKSDVNGHLSDRLAAEAFQIIAEGLSNVLRHTSARHAFVHLLCEGESLLLKIGNEAPPSSSGALDFTPSSIDERTRMLGGVLAVEHGAAGYTVIHITIPISCGGLT